MSVWGCEFVYLCFQQHWWNNAKNTFVRLRLFTILYYWPIYGDPIRKSPMGERDVNSCFDLFVYRERQEKLYKLKADETLYTSFRPCVRNAMLAKITLPLRKVEICWYSSNNLSKSEKFSPSVFECVIWPNNVINSLWNHEI